MECHALHGQTLSLSIMRFLSENGRNVSAFKREGEKKSLFLSLVFWMHSVKMYEKLTAFLFLFFSDPHPLPPVDLGLKANWSQCCPIWEWSRLLRSLICLVWWALAEVIQPLNLSAYLSNSWANTHSPSALGLIFKHLEKTGPSVYASIFLHICT